MTYDNIVSDLEGILKTLIPIADRVGNDEIKISKTRAKEMLLEIKRINNEKEKAKSKHIRREPAWLTNPD